MIEARSIEMTRNTQILVGAVSISLTGRRWSILIATAIHPNITQRKFRHAAISTDFFGLSEWLYITGAIALAVSFIPFTNSNATTTQRQTISKINIPISIPKIIYIELMFLSS